jgi:RNA polymerase sigma-70 factor (ECF subfamily)
MLCAYAHRLVALEDAEEIVQDTLLWVWENRHDLSIETSLTAYLFRTVHRRALNRLEHIDVVRRADTHYYEEAGELLHDIDLLQQAELTKRIEEGIAALPDSYRAAFVAHRFHGQSYKEIAEAAGVSPKTIDYRIGQALKLLRVSLKEYLPVLLL